MQSITFRASVPLLSLLLAAPAVAWAQATPGSAATAATASPRQSGTVKAVTPQDFVLTNAAGQDFAVNVPATAHILLVDPATRDLKTARPGSMADIAGGDKAIVSGTAGDTGQTLNATRVLLLKSGAIAALHASEQAAWAHSVGGVVRSVDSGTGTLTVADGQRTTTVTTTPATTVRRYAPGSVKFEDAVHSTVGAIQPGDQVQARGQRTADRASLAADEIVAGSFSNFSGTVTAVDAAAGTVTLKDLASKKIVTVAVTGQTNVRKLPAGFAQGVGARAAGTAGEHATGETQPSSPQPAPSQSPNAPARRASGTEASSGAASGRRLDLARAVNRFPTDTLGDLKQGEAVMIVASNAPDNGTPTAITLLSGVETLLTGSAAGQTTLTPWSLGGEAEGGGETSNDTGSGSAR